MRNTLSSALFVSAIALLPCTAAAEVLELSQGQIRQLVAQQQVRNAEAIVSDAVLNFGGTVIDIRGFLFEGRMTYRLLLQRDDGSVIELLINGVNGERISHNGQIGQSVSTAARAKNASAGRANNQNSQAPDERGRSDDRGAGRSDNSDRSGDRGNAGGGRSDNRRD